MLKLVLITVLGAMALLFLFQRKLLYLPTHHTETNGLAVWGIDGRSIGYARKVGSPQNVWLVTHGNAGQAADRTYVLPCFSDADAVFIMEYPGYGNRTGSPNKSSFDAAAAEAYHWLRKTYPGIPVCLLGESIGSGPAASLAQQKIPPDKIVLVVPFNDLASVAQEQFPLIPARLMLLDRWDNSEALKGYGGKVEIYGAVNDQVIPVHHAKTLADSLTNAVFHAIPGGHNDWSQSGAVQIRNINGVELLTGTRVQR
ncbi:MAG: alpha/beta hydrolase [Trichlorobacter sp.]|uniref:alpha/beta fold hydrolase n=1 Tax=Trichlorobacter sp. TaxID=2911007 RepID=UPI00256DB1BB|nr:alpha/beta fold hydrolase [Trichlorobacter sp.]MDK9717870.1 alpha/beta hydrolase [Trichlorobacter sp.]